MGQHYKLHALLWERRAGAGPAEDAGRAPVLIAERDASFPLHHLIFPYYAEGCMASCMRDHIISATFLRADGLALQFAPPELKADREVVLAAVVRLRRA